MSDEPKPVERTSRRKFWKRAAIGAAAASLAGAAYPLLEARWCRLTRRTLALPNLPASFRGLSVAYLSDLHHGPYVGLDYIRHVVDWSNALKPDLVLLGGDYVSKSSEYIGPVCREMARLRAPMGRFAVLGNHDNWESGAESRAELDRAGLELIDNRGVWLRRGGDRLRVGGVGDLWTDEQSLPHALEDAHEGDAVVLLSHNPDYAEYVRDPRVGLMLSGHTHGGQVVVPGVGAVVLPSRFGRKYSGGLVQGPAFPVFVGRGVGTSGPPVRFYCRPELVMLTLV
ncbi:metallophosphoesterase [Paludisphaera mucosa]|uniref:Metallophosphoesterase n=1 Tax=Paludisphaera mucosa TaxID=3030827 RepID=A0ABT6FJA7_9BACT|nr:metallophosphoesterase [Paludisphaera mucosa]MDG3007658.1 metallophosphoesterase [Paludisphaera mucosa]